MELGDFPRPKGDTGIGVQWSLGYAAAVGSPRLEQRWIPLLRALGIKWVSFRYPGGETLARLLMEHDIMPIVQLGRFRAYPGRLAAEQLKALKAYRAAGVRYFELGDPLDSPASWQGGKVPNGALTEMVSHLIADIETVLQLGGLPGLPATYQLTPEWDVVGAICEAGRQDVLEAGVWQAYHITAGNLPLDFPNDPVTLTGRPLTEEEYRRGLLEAWAGSTWAGRSREEINAERIQRRDPDADLRKTPAGWRRHEILDARIRGHLGRSLPILGTAGGCFIGEMTDKRYPAVSPKGHAARILEMARIMMGTSARFPPAPGYLFCAAFSLLGNYALGHFEPRWEPLAWVSPRWPGGRLPIVDALRNEPKCARWQEPAQGSSFALRFSPRDWEMDIIGEETRGIVPETFAPEPFTPQPPARLTGRLAGGAGRTITLTADKDGTVMEQVVALDGTFAFPNLRPGSYRLAVEGTNLKVENIVLESGDERHIALTMPAWSWRITPGERGTGFSIVRCSVEGRPGLPVRIYTEKWEGIERLTGSKTEWGPFYCELAPLAAGRYTLVPQGLDDVRVELQLDGNSVVYVEFIPTKVETKEPEPVTPPVNKGFERYLLLARPFTNKEDLLAVLSFLRAHQPACGFSVEEAKWAKEVLIVGGGTLRVSEEDEQALRESGCRVKRIETDIATTMMRLAGMENPFLES